MATTKKKTGKRKSLSQAFSTGRLAAGNFGMADEPKKTKKQSDKKVANTRQGPGPKRKTKPTASIVGNIAKKVKSSKDNKARQAAVKKRVAAKKRLDAKKKKAAKKKK